MQVSDSKVSILVLKSAFLQLMFVKNDILKPELALKIFDWYLLKLTSVLDLPKLNDG